MQQVQAHAAPLKLGTSEEFALVASALREASFDEQTICSAFHLGDMSDVARLRVANLDQPGVSNQLQILCRLFLGLLLVPRAEVERAFDEPVTGAFLSLGLLGLGEFGDNFHANVLLYPVS